MTRVTSIIIHNNNGLKRIHYLQKNSYVKQSVLVLIEVP